MIALKGKVYSHTVVRVPGNRHTDAAPFVLLLVELDNGDRLLGHFGGSEPPVIDTRVEANASEKTPVFRIVQENA